MYLIKACPSCKMKLRFPIDKGTIRVKCGCGYSFIANPDDPSLYEKARFDLSVTKFGLKKLSACKGAIAHSWLKQIIPSIMTSILNFKYRIQNFRLLPDAEKIKLLASIAAIAAFITIIALVIYLIFGYYRGAERIIV